MSEEEAFEDHLEAHHRDPAKESQILLWIWNALDEISCLDYDQYLRDGVILCRLMNVIKQGSVKGDVKSTNMREKYDNIERFISACKAYGVSKHLLFKIDDLLYLQHVPRVTRCIFALGKKVSEDSNYTGPQLGDEPYEPVGKSGRRGRGGLPLGDDIYVAHISVNKITDALYAPPKENKKRVSLYNF